MEAVLCLPETGQESQVEINGRQIQWKTGERIAIKGEGRQEGSPLKSPLPLRVRMRPVPSREAPLPAS